MTDIEKVKRLQDLKNTMKKLDDLVYRDQKSIDLLLDGPILDDAGAEKVLAHMNNLKGVNEKCDAIKCEYQDLRDELNGVSW